MTGMPFEVKFRLEAAARVLERAAERVACAECRETLLDLARRFREAAERESLEPLRAVATSTGGGPRDPIEEKVEELRKWLWQRIEAPRRGETGGGAAPASQNPIAMLDAILRELDRKLEEVIPI